jgi:hypothetical protein
MAQLGRSIRLERVMTKTGHRSGFVAFACSVNFRLWTDEGLHGNDWDWTNVSRNLGATKGVAMPSRCRSKSVACLGRQSKMPRV